MGTTNIPKRTIKMWTFCKHTRSFSFELCLKISWYTKRECLCVHAQEWTNPRDIAREQQKKTESHALIVYVCVCIHCVACDSIRMCCITSSMLIFSLFFLPRFSLWLIQFLRPKYNPACVFRCSSVFLLQQTRKMPLTRYTASCCCCAHFFSLSFLFSFFSRVTTPTSHGSLRIG